METEKEKKNSMEILDIPVDKIFANPFQPRQEFNEQGISSLAESIRQYGVMQPILVTKKDNGDYELIAGERRLRASKIAKNETIPAIIKVKKYKDSEKFELAIIENLQREDLNPVEKARSFGRLVEEFKLTHSDIAQKMGKSREYISNSLRILLLSDEMLEAMVADKISEGHARPLLMLNDRPYEQNELFKKIVNLKLTVRMAEKIARSIAKEKLRKIGTDEDVELENIEKGLSEKFGTRVSINKKNGSNGGKLTIEYFSREDLEKIISLMKGNKLSSRPVLDEDLENGIKKFSENFSDEITVDKDKKNFIENKIEKDIPISEDKVLLKKVDESESEILSEKEYNTEGFNILSFDSKKKSEILSKFKKETENKKILNDENEKKVESSKEKDDGMHENKNLTNSYEMEKESNVARDSFKNYNKNVFEESINQSGYDDDEEIFQDTNDGKAQGVFPGEINNSESILDIKNNTKDNINKILNKNKNIVEAALGDNKKTENKNIINNQYGKYKKVEKEEKFFDNLVIEEHKNVENSNVHKNFLESQEKTNTRKQDINGNFLEKNNIIKKSENIGLLHNKNNFIPKKIMEEGEEKMNIEKTNISDYSQRENRIEEKKIFDSGLNKIKNDVIQKSENVSLLNNGNDFIPKNTIKKEEDEKINIDGMNGSDYFQGNGEAEEKKTLNQNLDEDEIKKKSIFASFSDFVPKKKQDLNNDNFFDVSKVEERYKKKDEDNNFTV